MMIDDDKGTILILEYYYSIFREMLCLNEGGLQRNYITTIHSFARNE